MEEGNEKEQGRIYGCKGIQTQMIQCHICAREHSKLVVQKESSFVHFYHIYRNQI